MSEKKVKTYTAAFKESAVKLAVESDQPVTGTARDLGANTNALHAWISKCQSQEGLALKADIKAIHEVGSG